MPDDHDRQVVDEATRIIRTKTKDLTAAAADDGVSYMTMYRKVKRGEVDAVEWGSRGEMRVWA